MSNDSLDKLSEYGLEFQLKVLGILLNDREFLINTYELLDEDHFENPAHKWIIQNIKEFFRKYHTTISMETLKIELRKVKNEILQLSIKETLKKAYIYSDEINNEYIKTEFHNFVHNQKMKNAIMESVELLSKGKYDVIKRLITNAVVAGSDKNIGHVYGEDIEQRYREDERNVIPFPYPEWNEQTQGGYGNGDLVIIFGSPGSGKSWTIIDMVAHNIKQGYNVVYYTLELGESYVGKRVDARLAEIPVDELNKNKDKVIEILKDVTGKLIIKEYPPGRASLDDIENHLSKLKSQEEFVPDVIYIDYLDLLKPTGKKSSNKVDNIDDIYIAAKGLAKELKKPIVSPSQINRDGSKDVIAEGDKVAGSYGKLMIGDMTISLSRLRKDKNEGTGRYHFIKNRYGFDGITFKAQLDLSRGIIKMIGRMTEEEINDFDKQNKKYIANKGSDSFDKEDKEILRNEFLKYFKEE